MDLANIGTENSWVSHFLQPLNSGGQLELDEVTEEAPCKILELLNQNIRVVIWNCLLWADIEWLKREIVRYSWEIRAIKLNEEEIKMLNAIWLGELTNEKWELDLLSAKTQLNNGILTDEQLEKSKLLMIYRDLYKNMVYLSKLLLEINKLRQETRSHNNKSDSWEQEMRITYLESQLPDLLKNLSNLIVDLENNTWLENSIVAIPLDDIELLNLQMFRNRAVKIKGSNSVVNKRIVTLFKERIEQIEGQFFINWKALHIKKQAERGDKRLDIWTKAKNFISRAKILLKSTDILYEVKIINLQNLTEGIIKELSEVNPSRNDIKSEELIYEIGVLSKKLIWKIEELREKEELRKKDLRDKRKELRREKKAEWNSGKNIVEMPVERPTKINPRDERRKRKQPIRYKPSGKPIIKLAEVRNLW